MWIVLIGRVAGWLESCQGQDGHVTFGTWQGSSSRSPVTMNEQYSVEFDHGNTSCDDVPFTPTIISCFAHRDLVRPAISRALAVWAHRFQLRYADVVETLIIYAPCRSVCTRHSGRTQSRFPLGPDQHEHEVRQGRARALLKYALS